MFLTTWFLFKQIEVLFYNLCNVNEHHLCYSLQLHLILNIHKNSLWNIIKIKLDDNYKNVSIFLSPQQISILHLPQN